MSLISRNACVKLIRNGGTPYFFRRLEHQPAGQQVQQHMARHLEGNALGCPTPQRTLPSPAEPSTRKTAFRFPNGDDTARLPKRGRLSSSVAIRTQSSREITAGSSTLVTTALGRKPRM